MKQTVKLPDGDERRLLRAEAEESGSEIIALMEELIRDACPAPVPERGQRTYQKLWDND